MGLDSYFAGFDLIRRDSGGVEIPLANYELTIRYAAGADIQTLESDDEGFVMGDILAAIDPESAIEFYDAATYAGVLSQISKTTALDAAIENKQHRFVIDDDYTTESETEFLGIYIQDLSDMSIAPLFAGMVRPGETLPVPYESAKNKSLRIYKVERDAENAFRTTDLSLADYVDFDPTSSRPEDRITVDTTLVDDGVSGNLFYNNAGTLGEINLWLYVERIVASFTVNLNTGSPQTAYTVPSFDFILTKSAFRNASENVSTGDPLSIKDRDGGDLLTQDLADFISTGTYKIQRVSSVAPVFQPGDTVVIQTASPYGSAATLEVDIFGYFRASATEDILDGGATGTSFAGAVTDGGDSNEIFTDIIDGGNA
jgi:hypothetical protein